MALLKFRSPPTPLMVPLSPRGRLEPIVKWAGGKRRLLPEIVRRLPVAIGHYWEPFCGGAALFWHLEPAAGATLSDVNVDLMNLYTQIAQDLDEVALELEFYQRSHNEKFFYDTRDEWNQGIRSFTSVRRAATFIYLNKTCFNGLWRVNRSGEFNVPMGDYKNPKILDETALRAASNALQGVELLSMDYRRAISGAQAGDFLYFDPPYIPLNPTSNFTSYTPGGFGAQQQQELADTARVLAARGCQVMLSNSDTPLTRELYRGFRVEEVRCGRSVGAAGVSRKSVGELIITSDYERRSV